MLFGEELGMTGSVTILAVIGGAATGLGTLLGIWIKGRREARSDSVRDYREMYVISQKERAEDRLFYAKEKEELALDRNKEKLEWRHEVHECRDQAQTKQSALEVQIVRAERDHQQQRIDDQRACDEKVNRLMADILQHEREKGSMLAEIRGMQSRILGMENATGTSPAVLQPGVILAKIDGTVLVFSPSLSGFTGWEPKDVQGKDIRMLMIDDEIPRYEAGIKSVIEGRVQIDPAKPIQAHLKHKDGKRQVPVTIYLDDRMMKNMDQIVLTISERPLLVLKVKNDH